MKKSSLTVLSQSLQICRPPFDLHRYFCLQQFSVLYSSYFSYHVQYCDDPSDEKTFVVAKDFKNIALAVFDVSLLGQPLYISLLVKWVQQNDAGWNDHMDFAIAVSVEGFLAIHVHLWYQGLCGSQLSVLLLWWSQYGVLLIFSCLVLWVSRDILLQIELSVGGFCLLLKTVASIKIYLAVKRHKNQIQVLQV